MFSIKNKTMKPLTQEQFEAIRDWLKECVSSGVMTLNEYANRFQPEPEQPTLIPFDLTAALANPDRVVYRDGSKPLEWHFFEKVSGLYPITSVATYELCVIHTKDGNQVDDENNTPKDLFLLPEAKKTYFANVYSEHRSLPMVGQTYNTEQTAINIGKESKDYLKTISFTI